jgi:chromosome segregation ATPase
MNDLIEKKTTSRSAPDNPADDVAHHVSGGFFGKYFSRIQRAFLEPVERQLTELASRLDERQAQTAERIEVLAANFDKLERQAARADSLERLVSQVSGLTEHLESVEQQLTEITSRVEQRQTQTADRIQDLAANFDRLEQKAGRIDSLDALEVLAARLEENITRNRKTISASVAAASDAGSQVIADLGAIRRDLDMTSATHSSHLQALELAKDLALESIERLRSDEGRAQAHLASLQEDHSAVRETVASLFEGYGKQREAMEQFKKIWTDLHRDITEQAEALSQLTAERPGDR